MNKVQFDSMAFQERKGTCGMKLERSGRNLAEKSGTDRDLKWNEICSVLFRFLNWYGMFRSFQAKQNGIDNLAQNPFIINCKCQWYNSNYTPKTLKSTEDRIIILPFSLLLLFATIAISTTIMATVRLLSKSDYGVRGFAMQHPWH